MQPITLTPVMLAIFLGIYSIITALAVYFMKKYLDRLEARGQTNAEGVEEAKEKAELVQAKAAEGLAILAKETAIALKDANASITNDLRECIHENRREYKECHNETIKRLDDMTEQMRIANGRTRKNELANETVKGLVMTQIALCKDRNSGRRSSDRCGDVPPVEVLP
jgi:F0F1-type ATP synthase membrane subunit b/b'